MHTPASVLLLSEAEALPSERRQARALREALTKMFGRSGSLLAADAAPVLRDAAAMVDEHALLDLCLKQLVKQLSTRCVEWGEVLETLRGRLDALWRAAAGLLAQRPATADALEALWLASAAATC